MTIFLIWYCRYKKIQKKWEFEFNIDKLAETYQTDNPLLDRVETVNQAGCHEKEFASENVAFVRELGEGAFGRVYQGVAADIITGEDSTIVAVKQLKLNDSEDDGATVVEFFKG